MRDVPRVAPHLKTSIHGTFGQRVGSLVKISSEVKKPHAFGQALEFSLDLPRFFDDALCTGKNPRIFDGETLGAVLAAKKICSDCPIQALCLSWATQTQDTGVWGGLTPAEREEQSGGTNPADIGKLRLLETNRTRLLSATPAAQLAAEFKVTERTIYRWRKEIHQNQIAS